MGVICVREAVSKINYVRKSISEELRNSIIRITSIYNLASGYSQQCFIGHSSPPKTNACVKFMSNCSSANFLQMDENVKASTAFS